MPGRIGIDLGPQKLLRNSAQPTGPLPAPKNAEGGVNEPGKATRNLLADTFTQLNTARHDGVGGKVDLIG